MKLITRLFIVFFVGIAFFLAPTGFLQAQSNEKPEALEGVGVDQKLDAQLPLDLLFYNEVGEQVRLGDFFKGKPVILSLVYYECPMLCTLILNGLVNALDPISLEPEKDFHIISVSFNPEEGAQLARIKKNTYLKRYRRKGGEEGWHFLTGSAESIRSLTETVGFKYRYEQESGEFAHASTIIILTPDGKIARYFFGIEYPPMDLRLSLVEASKNKIGNFVDQVLLFCFHYDPTTGKYGLVIMNLLRLFGILTVVSIGTAIFLMSRKKK